METYTGYLVDLVRELRLTLYPRQIGCLSTIIKKAGYAVVRKQYYRQATQRAYVEKVPAEVFGEAFRAMGLAPALVAANPSKRKYTHSPERIEARKPVAETKPTNGDGNLLPTLHQLVTTLNVVVEQLEREQAANSALRKELARLSVKARSAMVVYGG